MKIKDGFILRKMSDMGVVVPVGRASQEFEGMVTLNETGIFLWEALQQETSREVLIAALTQEYEVEPQRAARDVDAFLGKAREAGVLAE